ncbi:flagellar basal body protein FliL [Paenibacillus psychroresistens]|uniref:Flagellar protein FliL n=1 Tax=Paenibacillus psychroresistens TaxID=1778678 RepID=A0A6B8RLK3_9BACL|nr:flagellar basal body-associated FliL family protein [Paenibacillus psychroresistens]QGQ96238.1 flagellar basal body protein FliL [Paenibacillus psychroresistens]
MFKKLLPVMIAVLVVITLILIATYFLWDVFMNKDKTTDPATEAISSVKHVTPKPPSAAKVKSLTVTLKDITTNLATKNKIIVVGFAFVLENKAAMHEFTDLEIKVKSVINQTLADLTVEQVTGSAGQDTLKSTLMNKINAFMEEGKVTEINIPNIITQ